MNSSIKLSPENVDNSVYFKDSVVSAETKSYVKQHLTNQTTTERQLMTRQLMIR